MRAFFVFFLGSGFAGLVYEVVWLRAAMATFGVTTPLVSLVLSVFMTGLALGSWLGGLLARRLASHPRRPLMFYAAVEAGIGLLALGVVPALDVGRSHLASYGTALAWDSASYYVASGAWIALTLLPACIAMGATFPLAMAAIRAERPDVRPRSFSFLYLANVIGATGGTLASAFVLIELLGFRSTLLVAVVVNVLVAIGAAVRSVHAQRGAAADAAGAVATTASTRPAATVLGGLFVTGLVSMAMELVWIRQFTPYLGNVVYAFAAILATYLAATFVGTQLYRAFGAMTSAYAVSAWTLAGIAGLLPLLLADPRVPLGAPLRLLLGVVPVCALIGMLTPMLVDRWSGGDADRAGAAYAVNVVGSIAGPLLAGFWLLPRFGEHTSIGLLTVPLLAVGVVALIRPAAIGAPGRPSRGQFALVPVAAALVVALLSYTRTYETVFSVREVRRDHTATVIATGEGLQKVLLVNGSTMTVLSPLTKWMAHMPLAFLERRPTDALVICFGMGTTFRSLLTWDIDVTAVELVPSVPELFPYFHADAAEVVRAPNGRIVIDDGRRFLERSRRSWDVITIDPPFPPEAAGSSVLYSREFYATARARLRAGGILQQWVPVTESALMVSAARALAESFPHVRVFPVVRRTGPVEVVGIHFLASERAIPRRTATELVARVPPRAAADLLEWTREHTVEQFFAFMLAEEAPMARVIGLAPWAPALADDRPFNEYFLLRRSGLL
ncbi:MAG: fused MFS/spermidine synthase [Candidatus Rokubacteria bacterium]|nr:fused MFS/spermidine synthase [Candidatus Rokubacteria bacterium]